MDKTSLVVERGELLKRIAELKAENAKLRGWVKPGHGPCCTCQTCGKNYDDCRCDLEDAADRIAELEAGLRAAKYYMGSSGHATIDALLGDE